MAKHNFNENLKEWSASQGKELPVWISPQYEATRNKAIQILDKYESVQDSDFWILMRETRKKEKMGYMGLIISHRGCLKINDELPPEQKFNPSCVTVKEDGFGKSLVFTYINEEQGIYEVGEVSERNCKNDYPYAMALKRCFDRVVLKISKLAFAGIYSESEAEEFKDPVNTDVPTHSTKITAEQKQILTDYLFETGTELRTMLDACKIKTIDEMNATQYQKCVAILMEKKEKKDE